MRFIAEHKEEQAPKADSYHKWSHPAEPALFCFLILILASMCLSSLCMVYNSLLANSLLAKQKSLH